MDLAPWMTTCPIGGTTCPETSGPAPMLAHLTDGHRPEQVAAALIRQRHITSRLGEALETFRDLELIAEREADVIAPDPNREEEFTEIQFNTKP